MGNPAGGLIDGRTEVATAGTRVQLSTTAVEGSVLGVEITAETNNTGLIVFGGSTVVAAEATRRGTPLTAGTSRYIETDNLSDVWLDSTVSTDGVTWTALVR